MANQGNKYLLSIVGPTGIGKTALAIKLAQHFQTEIISADSRQFYKEISIGTAKPTEEELKQVKHHFIGNKSIAEVYSAGDFERDAFALLQELFKKYDLVVMAGGSGLYLRAVWEGLHAMPAADEQLRGKLKKQFGEEGIEVLQKQLLELDPERYGQIDKQNPQRLMRAIELAMQVKKGFASLTAERKEPRFFINIKIGLNMERKALYERINQRVDKMIAKGLVEECRRVEKWKNNYALQTVGYEEIFDHFENKFSLAEAIELIKQHSRNYAKKQLTWFRQEKDLKWFEPEDFEEIVKYVRTFR